MNRRRLGVVVGLMAALATVRWASPSPGAPPAATAPSPTSRPAVTFARDVAPIVYANCVSCHRAGEVGPFPLVTYDDVKRHARQIAAVTSDRTMPPWKPDVGIHFKYERRLTAEQIATLARWVDGGAPPGDARDRPPVPRFPSGWDLGPPDMILTVPQPYTVPAEGPDMYVHFVLPPLNLPADRYLRAVQVRPSNRRVAHHGVPMLDASGTARRLAAAHGGGNYLNFGGPGFVPSGFLPGYAPGMTIHPSDGEVGITLPKGADVVLQMHYHPTGKPEVDRPQIGLYFAARRPRRSPGIILMGTEDVDIPAGEAAHERRDTFRVPVDFRADTVWAHMHLLGRRVHVWADLPDAGGRRELLRIDDWDFAWQDTYAYAAPVLLPKGTVVTAAFTWDNTSDNVRNPNVPPRRVTLGENSTDEMAGLIVGGVAVHPADEGPMWLSTLGHYLLDIHGHGFKK